ncbi:flavodoxin family protein [Clostridium tyrobutyricum]|uniref:flavodoxin family protein n=1 Tax=Clostridium tyrobutyricum TaxID=1519 RepID=UPI001C394BAB|nr:flavodoxin family protein [Clostridium tyrobutyricum]MBV4417836.1 flavodoxin family protein [Clostridium tyrobutyricum]
MKLLIHDLKADDLKKIFSNILDDMIIISDDGTIHNCIGCFGCWIKTPAACVIHDKYKDMGEYLSKCSDVIIISECYYGGFSPFVKNVLDRSISYLHPYFIIKNGEMHHRRRYNNNINMQVYFYGKNITERERQTAKKLVKANSINLHCIVDRVKFIRNIFEMKGQIL